MGADRDTGVKSQVHGELALSDPESDPRPDKRLHTKGGSSTRSHQPADFDEQMPILFQFRLNGRHIHITRRKADLPFIVIWKQRPAQDERRKRPAAHEGEHESNREDSHSCCMCHASVKTLSLSPLLADMVIISGFIESGSWTWRVCLVGEDERSIMGCCDRFEPSIDAEAGKRCDVDICGEGGPKADPRMDGRKGVGGAGKREAKCLSMLSCSARRDG